LYIPGEVITDIVGPLVIIGFCVFICSAISSFILLGVGLIVGDLILGLVVVALDPDLSIFSIAIPTVPCFSD
jgi:hypothetical protein